VTLQHQQQQQQQTQHQQQQQTQQQQQHLQQPHHTTNDIKVQMPVPHPPAPYQVQQPREQHVGMVALPPMPQVAPYYAANAGTK